MEEPAARGPTPLEHASARELWEKVEEKLATLPEQPARVARLHLLADLSLAEIARALGLAPSTVRGHWALARKALRELSPTGFLPEGMRLLAARGETFILTRESGIGEPVLLAATVDRRPGP